MPYVGPLFDASRARILILGKATEGDWRCEKHWGYTFEEHAERFVLDAVATGEYSSAFWHFIVTLVPEVLRAVGEPLDDSSRRAALERIAWSNIFKLGLANGGAPQAEFAMGQLPAMTELVKLEVSKWKPTAIVATVGDSYGTYVREIFGDGDWTELDSRTGKDLWAKTSGAARVYWMRHPQGATRELLDAVRGVIASDQAAFVR